METATRGVRAEACSDIAVANGAAESEWLVESRRNEDSTGPVVSTADVALAPDGTMYVIDADEVRIVHLSAAGVKLNEWGSAGDGPGEIRMPSAIAIGPNKRVYVGDGRGRISVFGPQGDFITSLRAEGMQRIADILVLPNGNIVVAIDATPREAHGAYVAIVDSAGSLVRDVLRVSPSRPSGIRPLLGHEVNLVRLSLGDSGRFAVWYPIDNYFEVFDSAGVELSRTAGCLPQAINDSYVRQGLRGSPQQSYLTITSGMAFDSDGTVRVASFHMKDNTRTIRIRRYSGAGRELEARDFDVSSAPYLDRVEFVGECDFITFHSGAPESGIRRFTMR